MSGSLVDTFEGKIAVVTGAASGIGDSVARYLATRGARIVAVDLSEKVTARVKAWPGPEHHAIVANLADPSAGTAVIDETVQTVGVPQILVNSAGLARLDPAVDVRPEHWQQTLDVNLSGTFFMAQAAGRVMLKAGFGRIINLASQAAVVGLDQHAAYCASKAAVIGLTQVLSLEWAPHGVTVNAVSPTIVETPLGKAAWAGEKGEKAKQQIPVGRFAQPEEVAALVAFLASDEAAMITGSNYLIDGGYTSV